MGCGTSGCRIRVPAFMTATIAADPAASPIAFGPSRRRSQMLHRRSVLSGGLAFTFGIGRSWAQTSSEENIAAVLTETLDARLKERVDVGRESTGLVAVVLAGRRRI